GPGPARGLRAADAGAARALGRVPRRRGGLRPRAARRAARRALRAVCLRLGPDDEPDRRVLVARLRWAVARLRSGGRRRTRGLARPARVPRGLPWLRRRRAPARGAPGGDRGGGGGRADGRRSILGADRAVARARSLTRRWRDSLAARAPDKKRPACGLGCPHARNRLPGEARPRQSVPASSEAG